MKRASRSFVLTPPTVWGLHEEFTAEEEATSPHGRPYRQLQIDAPWLILRCRRTEGREVERCTGTDHARGCAVR